MCDSLHSLIRIAKGMKKSKTMIKIEDDPHVQKIDEDSGSHNVIHPYPRCSMSAIFTYKTLQNWVIFWANVGT